MGKNAYNLCGDGAMAKPPGSLIVPVPTRASCFKVLREPHNYSPTTIQLPHR